MKSIRSLFVLSSSLLLLSSCNFLSNFLSVFGKETSGANESNEVSLNDSSFYDISLDTSIDNSVYEGNEPSGGFNIESTNGFYSKNNSTYIISKAGEYYLSGLLNEGHIEINTSDSDDVIIVLNGAKISCSEQSPIYSVNANKIKIKSQNNSYNEIIDNRSIKTNDDANQGEGAISTKCDLSLVGKGTLVVTGNYNNGIHTTKDLKIKNTILKVNAVNNSLKGKDNVTIESGTLLLSSSSGDGIKTENSDISSKGNQRGNVTITGGIINIYSACDGIDASYNVNISSGVDDDGNTTVPALKIFTDKYSEYTGESSLPSLEDFYISHKSTYNKSSTKYAVYFYNSDSEYTWVDAPYYTSMRSGGNSTYYYYKLKRNPNYANYRIFRFLESEQFSLTNYDAAMSDGKSINSNYDTVQFSISGNVINPDRWTTFQQSGGQGGPGGGFNETNTDKAEGSAKGIKSQNEVNISNGLIEVKAYDDAIKAAYGTSLENGSIGLGNVNISGGDLSLYASDDGIHADREVSISGGNVDISNAYEGIEANIISIKGGDTKVYATDDGLNASRKVNINPEINVSGGKIDITVATGDVDGIDSNGSYTQTGGIVITRGAQNSNSRMATGLDVDGEVKMSSGTLICFGTPEKTPSMSGNVISKTYNGTCSKGNYIVDPLNIEVTLIGTYTNMYVFSDQLTSSSTVKLQIKN